MTLKSQSPLEYAKYAAISIAARTFSSANASIPPMKAIPFSSKDDCFATVSSLLLVLRQSCNMIRRLYQRETPILAWLKGRYHVPVILNKCATLEVYHGQNGSEQVHDRSWWFEASLIPLSFLASNVALGCTLPSLARGIVW